MFNLIKQQSSGHYSQVNNSLEEGKTDEALNSINQALIKYPNEIKFHLLKIKILMSLGQDDYALKASNEALYKNPGNLEAKLKQAELLYKLERFEEAMSVYSEMLEIHPDNASWLYWKGMCLEHSGDKLKAIVCYIRSIELDPSNYLFHYAKGVILHERKQCKDAYEAYSKALELNPQFHEVYYKLGLIGSYFNKDEEAMILYQKASELDPKNISYHNLCGHAAYSAGRKQTAFNSYMTALEHNPNDTVSWYNSAIVAFEIGKIDQAKEFFTNILEDHSKSIIETLDQVATLRNSLDVYLNYKLDTTIPVEYVRSKAMILELLGENDAALLMYNKAIIIDPDDALTYHNQGRILCLLEKYEEAIKCFNLALSLDISDLNSYLYNILSHYALNADTEAHTLFPALNSFGQEDDIIEFIANLSWQDDDPYIPKEARILLDLLLFSRSYAKVFSLFVEKNINFNLKISPDDNTSLFVAIIQSKDDWLMDQLLQTNQNFEEILRELILDLNDSTCVDLLQRISSKSDKIANGIKRGEIKMLDLAIAYFKPQVAEYLLELNIDLINQLNEQDRDNVAEFITVIQNKELSCILQEKFNFDLQDKLKQAIRHNDLELVSNILIIAPSLLETRFEGMPIGHWALQQSKLEVIELILNHDLNIEFKLNSQNRNLLTFALIERKFNIAEKLIVQYNFNIGEPLCNILQGNNSNFIFNILNSLLRAALNHQSIGVLLNHPRAGAIRDEGNNTALHIVVKNSLEEFLENNLEDLTKMVNEKNRDGRTPLHLLLEEFTGYFAQIKILDQLLQMKDVDIKTPDKEGFTAIDIAANFAHYAFKKMYESNLISAEDLSDPTYSRCLPLIMKTEDIRRIKDHQEEILKNTYPLHYACSKGNEQQITTLLSYKRSHNTPDLWGYLPLYYAVSQNNTSAVKLLTSRNDVDIIRASNKLNRTTILHSALYQDNLDTIKYLFEKAVDLEENVSTLRGHFHRALVHRIQSPQAASYLVDIFKKLNKKNPIQYKLLNPNDQDVYGHTALYYASLLPDQKLMDYWFKLSIQHPKQYSIDISLNQKLICNAAFNGNTAVISYLLERQRNAFDLESDANNNLIEISICGQGPRTIKFLFQNYPKSYLLVKDPAKIKEMVLFFKNEELTQYLDDARLLNILYKHSEYQLLKKIEEVETRYQNKLQELEGKYTDIKYATIQSIGSMTNPSLSGTQVMKPFLGTIRRKLSELQRGFVDIKEQQLEHDEIILLTGADERARVQKEMQHFKTSEPKLHNYCSAFYYGLSTYIMTYKTLSTGAIQTSEDISDTAAKFGIKLILKTGKAVSKGIPIVASVVAFLDLVVVSTYGTIQSLKLQNKIQIINDIIKKKAPLEDELSLSIAKTSVAVTKIKALEINKPTPKRDKTLKWIEKKLKNVKECLIGEEIINTPSATLAMKDVGMIVANMYKEYSQIVSSDKPLDEILIGFALNTTPVSSPQRKEEARRRSAFNLYEYNQACNDAPLSLNIKEKFGEDPEKSLIAQDSMLSFSTDSTDA